MTITNTTAAAVSRKLSTLGFQKFDNNGIGFKVYEAEAAAYWGTQICVTNFGYDNGYRSSIAEELQAEGYDVEIVVDNAPHLERRLTSLIVFGKVGA
jgi:hypothetical protein